MIGSGYCGLSCALELARAGARVAALDSGALGAGASTRNGGMVGGAVKLDWQDLARRYGRERAAALVDGARASFEHPRGPDRARAAGRRLRALRPLPSSPATRGSSAGSSARSRRWASGPRASAWCRASASARRSARTSTTAASRSSRRAGCIRRASIAACAQAARAAGAAAARPCRRAPDRARQRGRLRPRDRARAAPGRRGGGRHQRLYRTAHARPAAPGRSRSRATSSRPRSCRSS